MYSESQRDVRLSRNRLALAGYGYADDMTVRFQNLLTPDALDYYRQMHHSVTTRSSTQLPTIPTQSGAQSTSRPFLISRNVDAEEQNDPLDLHPPYSTDSQD